MTNKERMAALVQQLRDQAKMQDPTARAAVEVILLAHGEAKESLVTADGSDMLRAQGLARGLLKLHRDLITTPPNIAQEQTA